LTSNVNTAFAHILMKMKTFKSDYCALSNRPIFTVFDPAQ
jgi:hypothetical protein